MGGYRLNTDFREVKLDLGRAFGFAFGHKENGAMFSHMAVLADIYRHCQDFPRSRTLPGIPEYIDPRGRGVYPWLTGCLSPETEQTKIDGEISHETKPVPSRLGRRAGAARP